MPRPPSVRPLPEPERRETLGKFLEVLERDPDLAHFRSQVPAGEQRQLALFAALERAVFRGNGIVCPPATSDVADQLLCDILEACDRPPLKSYGGAYGPDRYRINLQALGAWTRQPQALELFATTLSHLNASAAESWPLPEANSSPPGQMSAPFGEISAVPIAEIPMNSQEGDAIVRHGADEGGEQCADGGCAERQGAAPRQSDENKGNSGPAAEIPLRVVRRGRPPSLDEMAKGRLLGLMAFGLSFRQAAAQLGVHHQTLLNIMKRDEQFAQQVAEARLDAISQPLMVVVQAARTNWRAAAWLARYLNERRVSGYERTPEEAELAKKREST